MFIYKITILLTELFMDIENVMAQLNEASKTKYYKFTYKGDGKCKICQQFNGKVFSEDDIPQTHPNCKCATETKVPADIAMGKYKPQSDYYIGKLDFNKNRRQIEEKYGRIIDNSQFSAPGYELADNINKKGLQRAVFDHKIFREGKQTKSYFDGKNIPTIGIGVNMLTNMDRLLKMKVITQAQYDTLKWWKGLSETERKDNKNRLTNVLQGVELTDEQIFSFFAEDCQKAEDSAKDVMCKGGWTERTRQNGTKNMEWSDSLADNRAWDKLPNLVKAICADMVFNLGKDGFTKYPSFIKAIKAGDYRRAAMELVDSADYKSNIKTSANTNPKNPGLAKRRLDAAIELTKLADEEDAKKRQSK